MILRPNPVKWISLMVLSAGFTAVGIAMIRTGDRVGWLVSIVFGLCLATSVTALVPGSSYLKLAPSGLTIRSLFRAHDLPWSHVASFGVGVIGHQRLVVISFTPAYGRKGLRRAAGWMSGYEGALPDTYGMRPEALAILLNEWRARYTTEENSGGSDHP